jgi:glutathione-regulated potassium-efflux system ancillary protein KefC
MDRGVTLIERETFDSALQLGRRVLQEFGFGAYQARQAAMRFRAHNLKTLHAVYPYYKDQQQMISMAAQAREELEAMFAQDLEILTREGDGGWEKIDLRVKKENCIGLTQNFSSSATPMQTVTDVRQGGVV